MRHESDFKHCLRPVIVAYYFEKFSVNIQSVLHTKKKGDLNVKRTKKSKNDRLKKVIFKFMDLTLNLSARHHTEGYW